jgi:hypothetical protein
MSSSYKPYVISNFKSGLMENLESWMLPIDAFAVIENMNIYQGVLEKRQGYTEYGRMVDAVLSESLAIPCGASATSGTYSNTDIRDGDITIQVWKGGAVNETITDDTGVLTGTQGTSGTVDYTTGDWTLLFHGTSAGKAPSASYLSDYDYHPGNQIMGIWNYYASDGTEELLAMDIHRLNKWNNTKFEDPFPIAANPWDGTPTSYIWATSWKDKMYMVNNANRIMKYNSTEFTELDVLLEAPSAGGVNEVNTCLAIVPYKDRLILFRTDEVTDGHGYQRARWCTVNNPDDWTNDGYIDAPTIEWIMSVEFLGDDLLVFFERSVWKLDYTGDYDLPFIWTKVADSEGCYASFTASLFSDEVVVMGPTGLVGCDGRDAYRVDDQIPDKVLTMNPGGLNMSYAGNLDERRQLWLTYPGPEADTPDKILVLNYKEQNWSVFNIPTSTIGFTNEISDITWGEIEGTWNETERTWDDKQSQASYPITLVGSNEGYIYKVNTGGQDNGADISFSLESIRWNPFAQEGLKVRMGYIDFLVDADIVNTFDVDFYIDNSDTAYKTEIVDCVGTADNTKVWKRIYVGTVGEWHKIKLSHTASNQTLRIHAIVPYFKAAGRMYNG